MINYIEKIKIQNWNAKIERSTYWNVEESIIEFAKLDFKQGMYLPIAVWQYHRD